MQNFLTVKELESKASEMSGKQRMMEKIRGESAGGGDGIAISPRNRDYNN